MGVKFLQFSDVHMGATTSSSKLNLPMDKTKQRQEELQGIFKKACAIAKERNIDIVLIPGDLWDDESISTDMALFTFEQLQGIAPIPVFITPGNHDYYSFTSFYNKTLYEETSRKKSPDNVHIFTEKTFQSFQFTTQTGVSINIAGIVYSEVVNGRLFAQPIPKSPDALNILVFHGSLDNIELSADKKKYFPFSKAELLNQGFDYAAIGHYHGYQQIKDEQGRIRGAYAGCPAGLGLDETGEKYLLYGEIEKGGRINLENISLDKRQIRDIEIKWDNLMSSDRVKEMIEDRLSQDGVNEDDIVYLRLNGVYPPAEPLYLPDDFLKERFFHVQIDYSGLRPDYDISAILNDLNADKKVEGMFVKKIMEKIEKAKKQKDEREERLWRAALYYGLDAVNEKEVKPGYED